jgi:hypothetical protein
MAESTLSMSYVEYYREVGRFLGLARSGLTGDDATDVKDVVDSGYRTFLTAHSWTFMRPTTTLTTTAAYTTGTVTVASGVVTLTGGTFPSWAAEGDFIVAGVTYSVNTRDSNTQITLDDTSVTVASASSYTLGRPTYTLPDDFGGMDGPLTYRPGVGGMYGAIPIVSDAMIRSRRQWSDYTGRPRVASIKPVAFVAATGQRWQISFDPIPDGAYILTYPYKAIPASLISDVYPLGGVFHNETILEGCLAKAELRLDDGHSKAHAEAYLLCLAQSIKHDREQHSPDHMGFNHDPGESYETGSSGSLSRNPSLITTYNDTVHYD